MSAKPIPGPTLPMVAQVSLEQYNRDYGLLKDAIESVHETVARVERAVTGDPAFGHRGIVDRLSYLEERDRNRAVSAQASTSTEFPSTSNPPFSKSEKKVVRKIFLYILSAVAGATAAKYTFSLGSVLQKDTTTQTISPSLRAP